MTRTNQDLIDQLNADKVRLADLIILNNALITQNLSNIASYTSAINDFYTQNTALETDITNLNTAIANDDLIIAFIPPDISKK
ncbi:hypothetical protein UFOVP51_64 [uncultured Caudovirales phage]|uniref:Uncharacterized protein n=1 Tax=uncultured Caudovirales phage TaxID=2100421 RepID=A0A6J5KVG6_9CAUD|nr:hypothetical protein UFOVP51_64 [uncultured Caudovirales phage]CAB4240911.1 hypothetical protein UFOVP34_42 [uncultured Caudovirales phage]